MPTVTKLATEALDDRNASPKGKRQRLAEQYDTLLAPFEVGDWDVFLEADEERATVSRRLKAAASRRGLITRFRQRRDSRLRFQMLAPAPVPAVTQPRPKREAAPAPAPAAPQPVPTQEATPTVEYQPANTRRIPTDANTSRRAAAKERYRDVLPRWMRDGRSAAPAPHRKRRSR